MWQNISKNKNNLFTKNKILVGFLFFFWEIQIGSTKTSPISLSCPCNSPICHSCSCYSPIGPSSPCCSPIGPSCSYYFPIGRSCLSYSPIGQSCPCSSPISPYYSCCSPIGHSCPCFSPIGQSCPCFSPIGQSCPCSSPIGLSYSCCSPIGQVSGGGLWTVPEGLFCGLSLLSSLNLSSNFLQVCYKINKLFLTIHEFPTYNLAVEKNWISWLIQSVYFLIGYSR